MVCLSLGYCDNYVHDIEIQFLHSPQFLVDWNVDRRHQSEYELLLLLFFTCMCVFGTFWYLWGNLGCLAAVLPVAVSMYSIFLVSKRCGCQWDFNMHTDVDMRLHTGAVLTGQEAALEADSGRKSLAALGTRTHQHCAWLSSQMMDKWRLEPISIAPGSPVRRWTNGAVPALLSYTYVGNCDPIRNIWKWKIYNV